MIVCHALCITSVFSLNNHGYGGVVNQELVQKVEFSFLKVDRKGPSVSENDS